MDSTKIEDFYGVYLLCSKSPEKIYNGKCYIGFTVNPNRRIKQHNRGKEFGGAKKTSKKGPWDMVMIVHGFPNNISALQFEWAWQSPRESSRLKNNPSVTSKRRNETFFQYNFRILTEMLRTGPWNRLPLVVRWLTESFESQFPPEKVPPFHMQICRGPISIVKKAKSKTTEESYEPNNQPQTQTKSQQARHECHLCMQTIVEHKRSKITCPNPKCKLTGHIVCLANLFLTNSYHQMGQYVPIEGDCPICDRHFLWGDLIRKKNGCNDLRETDMDDLSEDDDDDGISEDGDGSDSDVESADD